jgi:hypothetical protein
LKTGIVWLVEKKAARCTTMGELAARKREFVTAKKTMILQA